MLPLGSGNDSVPHFGQNIGNPKQPITLMYANKPNFIDYLLSNAKITIGRVLLKS